ERATVHPEHAEPAQRHVDANLVLDRKESMIGHDEERGLIVERARRETAEEAPQQPIDVLDRPERLRRAWTVQVLEAVGAEKVHQQHVRRMSANHVRREIRHHRVLEKSFRKLRPSALALDRVAECGELLPDVATGWGLD